jgi:hypothetical protein
MGKYRNVELEESENTGKYCYQMALQRVDLYLLIKNLPLPIQTNKYCKPNINVI